MIGPGHGPESSAERTAVIVGERGRLGRAGDQFEKALGGETTLVQGGHGTFHSRSTAVRTSSTLRWSIAVSTSRTHSSPVAEEKMALRSGTMDVRSVWSRA